jgi:hypothetical protein
VLDEEPDTKSIDSDPNLRRKYNIAALQAKSSKEKSKIINTLHSSFTFKGSADFPVKSLSFVSTRVAILCFIFFISFLIDRNFINKDLNAVTKSLDAIKQNPMLDLTARQKRLINLQPQNVIPSFKRKIKSIDQIVTTFQASANINSFGILGLLSGLVKDVDVQIIKFQSLDNGDFNGVFKAQNASELETLEQVLNSTNIPNLFLEKDAANLTLNVSGGDIQ